MTDCESVLRERSAHTHMYEMLEKIQSRHEDVCSFFSLKRSTVEENL